MTLFQVVDRRPTSSAGAGGGLAASAAGLPGAIARDLGDGYVVHLFQSRARGRPSAPVAKQDELSLARTLGAHHGARYGGDPWLMAREHKITVSRVSRVAIEAAGCLPSREGLRVFGYILYGQPDAGDGPRGRVPRVFLDGVLSHADQTETLAHELGHWQMPRACDEAAEAWGQAFLSARRR